VCVLERRHHGEHWSIGRQMNILPHWYCVSYMK